MYYRTIILSRSLVYLVLQLSEFVTYSQELALVNELILELGGK